MAKEIVYVNADKKNRAEMIVANKVTQEISEETLAKWHAKIKEAKIEKTEDKVKFVYEGLGGLIGNSPEGEKHLAKLEEKKKEAKSR